MTSNVLGNEKLEQIQIGISKARKELVNYVLNCTEEQLFEMCDVLNSSNIRVTSWSCETCERYICSNNLPCGGIEKCLEYFAEMNKTKNTKEEVPHECNGQSNAE